MCKIQSNYKVLWIRSPTQTAEENWAIDTSPDTKTHRALEEKESWGRGSDPGSVRTAVLPLWPWSLDATEGFRADPSSALPTPPLQTAQAVYSNLHRPCEQRPAALQLRELQLFLRQMAAASRHLPSSSAPSAITNDASSKVSP